MGNQSRGNINGLKLGSSYLLSATWTLAYIQSSVSKSNTKLIGTLTHILIRYATNYLRDARDWWGHWTICTVHYIAPHRMSTSAATTPGSQCQSLARGKSTSIEWKGKPPRANPTAESSSSTNSTSNNTSTNSTSNNTSTTTITTISSGSSSQGQGETMRREGDIPGNANALRLFTASLANEPPQKYRHAEPPP